jgi:hypothetical protein
MKPNYGDGTCNRRTLYAQIERYVRDILEHKPYSETSKLNLFGLMRHQLSLSPGDIEVARLMLIRMLFSNPTDAELAALVNDIMSRDMDFAETKRLMDKNERKEGP